MVQINLCSAPRWPVEAYVIVRSGLFNGPAWLDGEVHKPSTYVHILSLAVFPLCCFGSFVYLVGRFAESRCSFVCVFSFASSLWHLCYFLLGVSILL
jgi:hypothetical protein